MASRRDFFNRIGRWQPVANVRAVQHLRGGQELPAARQDLPECWATDTACSLSLRLVHSSVDACHSEGRCITPASAMNWCSRLLNTSTEAVLSPHAIVGQAPESWKLVALNFETPVERCRCDSATVQRNGAAVPLHTAPFHRWVAVAKPVLHQKDAQHGVHSVRSAAFASFRVHRLNQRQQRLPRHHLPHFLHEPLPQRLLRLPAYSASEKAQLRHAATPGVWMANCNRVSWTCSEFP